MPGPPPEPTVLKVLKGNPGKRALPAGEPMPEPGIPDVPDYLGERARERWASIAPVLEDMRVLTMADGLALSLISDAMADYLEARDKITAKGAVFETEKKYQMASPWVTIRNKAFDRVVGLLKEFGMTPSARTRVRVEAKKEVSAFDEFLKGKSG